MKKVGKSRESRRRSAAKDLTARRSTGVKGGDTKNEKVSHSEFVIVKLVDAATPKVN